MQRIALFALIAPLVFLAGCSKSSGNVVSTSAPAAELAIPTAAAVVRTVPASFEVTGTFAADESSEVAPQVAGRVVATPVNVGDFVKKGQVICELDRRDAQIRVQQVEAQLAEATSGVQQTRARIGLNGGSNFDPNLVPEVAAAKAHYESAQAQARQAAADARRFENLVNTGDVSRSTYEKMKTQQDTAEAQANAARQQYEAALNGARQSYGAVQGSQAGLQGVQAQLAQARKALADTIIRAPFDGYVSARPIAVGEYVALTNKIATVVRVGTLKLELQTPEQRAAKVTLGMAVAARVSAFGDREFVGKVTAINPSVDPNSRIFVVEAQFANPRGELRPGMFATAKVMLPGGENAVFLPRTAVMRDRTTDANQVFVVENGKARLRVVVTGDAQGDQIRIVSGLTGNEKVAAARLPELYEGAPVKGS